MLGILPALIGIGIQLSHTFEGIWLFARLYPRLAALTLAATLALLGYYTWKNPTWVGDVVRYFQDDLTRLKEQDPELAAHLEEEEEKGPMEERIAQSAWSVEVRARLLRAWKKVQSGGGFASAEQAAQQKWVEDLMRIPVGVRSPSVLREGETTAVMLRRARDVLDQELYGMEEVKLRLLEILAMWARNSDGRLPVLALTGPPGVGKTTVAKALARVLDRPCQVLTLGGRKDAAELKGHSPTYVGASWGLLVDALVQARCMDPVIYLDEIDKVGVLGDDIYHVLTHATDPSSHDAFQDAYLAGIGMDLSRAFFVVSLNDVSALPRPLRDRMDLVEVPAYTAEDKRELVRGFLWPDALANAHLSPTEVSLSEEAIEELLEHPEAQKAQGVRPLKHLCGTLVRRVALLLSWSPEDRAQWGWTQEVPRPWVLTGEDVLALLLLGPKPSGITEEGDMGRISDSE